MELVVWKDGDNWRVFADDATPPVDGTVDKIAEGLATLCRKEKEPVVFTKRKTAFYDGYYWLAWRYYPTYGRAYGKEASEEMIKEPSVIALLAGY
ncbi:hypothetical protein [Pseudomonas phage RWG]|uniref:Uncharacterized protein n=2 Tax=Litunavirus Ab09 TaxID=1920765 RepID=A0A191ZBH3_9CAUD|nr:hypothetical protein BI066_gp21 [Pseudomonas phage PEV2]AIZ94771.1 hypothetical protein [Pseudomonas phage RWG]ANJ63721.1 hypothetical protein [Pseudomonas phage PEV2]UYE96527.1 hypothetical protein [Pseudomonas phage vB_PaeP_4032]UYE96613.1 hypothetical protein [Pseudomonas phage vB_PaeP_4034]